MTFNLDPALLHWGALEIRYYGILFGLAFITGYFFLAYFWKKEGWPLEEVDILVLYEAAAVIIGSRLGHILFYQPQFYLSHPLEILKIWHGGLASHGAAIGILIATWLFSKNYKRPFIMLADRLAIIVAVCSCYIRMGNFLNSEIVGRVTKVPWAVTFLRYDNLPRHPSQIYEIMMGLTVFVLLIFIYRRYRDRIKPGVLTGIFLAIYFGLRFFVEFFKEYEGLPSSSPVTMGQILSLPFVLAGLTILIRKFPWRSSEKEVYNIVHENAVSSSNKINIEKKTKRKKKKKNRDAKKQ